METKDDTAIVPPPSFVRNTSHFINTKRDTTTTTTTTTSSRAAAAAALTPITSIESTRRQVNLNKSDFGGRGEMYSGIWWQNRAVFLSNNFKGVDRLENATFSTFRGGGGVRLTRDWLDMSVDHLSKYVKHLNLHYKEQKDVRERLVEILRSYIHNAVLGTHVSSAVMEIHTTR